MPRIFNFDILKSHLRDLSEQISNGNALQAEIHARLLAEDLDVVSRPVQPTYKTGTGEFPPAVYPQGADMLSQIAPRVGSAQRYASQNPG